MKKNIEDLYENYLKELEDCEPVVLTKKIADNVRQYIKNGYDTFNIINIISDVVELTKALNKNKEANISQEARLKFRKTAMSLSYILEEDSEKEKYKDRILLTEYLCPSEEVLIEETKELESLGGTINFSTMFPIVIPEA